MNKDKAQKAVKGLRQLRHQVGQPYVMLGPSQLVTRGTLFATMQNGKGRFLVFRVDQRGL